MLLAARCAACDRPGPSPCPTCHAGLRPPVPEPDPPGLDGLVALLRYEGPARPVVARIKYRNQRQAVDWLAAGLAHRLAATGVHHVTWAPTTVAHRRRRGFDQAEVLARAVARLLDVPCPALLRRLPGPPQTGRSAVLRRAAGPSFAPAGRGPPPGSVVALVDDIVTTGATLRAVAATLRAAGPVTVVPVAAARTPARR